MVGGHIHICRRHVALPLGPLALSGARALLAAAAMAAVLLAVGTNPATGLLLAGGFAGIVAFVLTLLLVGEVTVSDLANVGRQTLARLPGRR
jgi:hypothetical protein